VLGIGIGLSINNALAVIEASSASPPSSPAPRSTGSRVRGTPGSRRSTEQGQLGAVRELALASYFTFVSLYAVAYGLVGTLPFIAIFQWGFF